MKVCEVSIVIPTYNGEKYLESIIETIKPYYIEGCEIIMVDDGSNKNDSTIDQFSKTFPKAVCVRQENAGVASARNRGAKLANGKYLQFLDIDDSITKDKIATQYAEAIKNDADVIYSDWRMAVVTNGNTEFEPIIESGEHDDYITSLLENWWNPPHSYLVKRECYERINGGNSSLVNAQDFDVFVRLAISGCKFLYVPGVYSYYYRYLNTTSLARGSRTQYWSDTEKVVKNAIKLLEQNENLKKEYKKAAAQRLFKVARNVYDIEKEWNGILMQEIKILDTNFSPKFESKKFNMLYDIFGYKNAERLIRILKVKRNKN